MMKMNLDELKQYVREVLTEVKKKKEKSDKYEISPKPDAYAYSESFDFSAPLGSYNLYKMQGAVNWGPQTGHTPHFDEKVMGARSKSSDALRDFLSDVVKEEVMNDASAWKQLAESVEDPKGAWETAAALVRKAK